MCTNNKVVDYTCGQHAADVQQGGLVLGVPGHPGGSAAGAHAISTSIALLATNDPLCGAVRSWMREMGGRGNDAGTGQS